MSISDTSQPLRLREADDDLADAFDLLASDASALARALRARGNVQVQSETSADFLSLSVDIETTARRCRESASRHRTWVQ